MQEEERYPTYRGTEEVVYLTFGDEWLGIRPADGGTHRHYGVDLEHPAFEVDTTDSEIFYTRDEQRQVAEDTIADADAAGIWPGKFVTEISEAGPFWAAEAADQDYLQCYPNGYSFFPRPGPETANRETAA